MAWICTGCGERYESNDPPCRECAGESLVPADEYSGSDGSGATGKRAPKWRCEGCGKVHPRNNPPCSRCGAMRFTNDPDADIDQGIPTSSPSDPRSGWWYASRAAAVLAAILLVAAGMSFVTGDPVQLQLFNDEPDPIEVAGYDESYEGTNLSAIERDIAAEINTRRSGGTLEWSSSLHAAAEYHNHRSVANNYRGWARDRETILEDIRSFGGSCQTFSGTTNDYSVVGDQAFVETSTESEIAGAIVDNLWQYESTRSRLEGSHSLIGVDLFVTEEKETLLVVYVC